RRFEESHRSPSPVRPVFLAPPALRPAARETTAGWIVRQTELTLLRQETSPARFPEAGLFFLECGCGLRARARPASRRGEDRRTAAGEMWSPAARPAWRPGRLRKRRRRGHSCCAPARSALARRSTGRSPR